jgi:hypothetical protein
MLKRQALAIQDIYVPVKRRQTLDPKKVEALAESMLAQGQRRLFWCELTASALCWWKDCIGWKPARPSVRQPSQLTLFRLVSIELVPGHSAVGDAGRASAAADRG